MSGNQFPEYMLAEIGRVYSEGIPSINKILDQGRQATELAEYIQGSIKALHHTLANSAGEYAPEQPRHADQGIHRIIDQLKEIKSLGENINDYLKKSIPAQTAGESNLEDGDKPIELEIKFSEEDKYIINLNNYQNQKIEHVEISILYENYTLPVHSIRTIKEYSKNSYTVKIPLNLFYYQGSVSVSIDTNEKNFITKQLFAIDILEIMRKGEMLQFKVRNNTGLTFKGMLCDKVTESYIEIAVEPGKIELFEQNISSGEFYVMRNEVVFSDFHKFY